jgi:hypothetical protein
VPAGEAAFFGRFRRGELTAEDVLAHYAAVVYRQAGSYEEAPRAPWTRPEDGQGQGGEISERTREMSACGFVDVFAFAGRKGRLFTAR